MIVLDWYTKKVVGWDISLRSRAAEWKRALEMAIITERMMRTIKEEIIYLNEFGSLEEVKEKISRWLEVDYNKLYVHSELSYRSPEEFEQLYFKQIALKEAA